MPRSHISTMASVVIGTLLVAATVDAAVAKTVAQCVDDLVACRGTCKPGGFSCDLLIKLCADDYKKCYDGASDKPATLDPGGGSTPPRRPLLKAPSGGILQQ